MVLKHARGGLAKNLNSMTRSTLFRTEQQKHYLPRSTSVFAASHMKKTMVQRLHYFSSISTRPMAQILPHDPFMIRMKSLTSPSKWGLWIGLEINYFAPQNMSKKYKAWILILFLEGWFFIPILLDFCPRTWCNACQSLQLAYLDRADLPLRQALPEKLRGDLGWLHWKSRRFLFSYRVFILTQITLRHVGARNKGGLIKKAFKKLAPICSGTCACSPDTSDGKGGEWRWKLVRLLCDGRHLG